MFIGFRRLRGSISLVLERFARVLLLGLRRVRQLRLVRPEFIRWQVFLSICLTFPILFHCITGTFRSFVPGECAKMLAAPADLFAGSILFSLLATFIIQVAIQALLISNDMRRTASRAISPIDLVRRVSSRFAGLGVCFAYYAAIFLLLAMQYPEAACRSDYFNILARL
jgi:hypothetical protein